MEASLALQKALIARLKATAALTDLVPRANIYDRHGLPERFPSIILGEAQILPEEATIDRRHSRVYLTLHLWSRDNSLVQVKQIAGAVRGAVRERLWDVDEHKAIDLEYADARFLRDPDAISAHGVITLEALVAETV